MQHLQVTHLTIVLYVAQVHLNAVAPFSPSQQTIGGSTPTLPLTIRGTENVGIRAYGRLSHRAAPPPRRLRHRVDSIRPSGQSPHSGARYAPYNIGSRLPRRMTSAIDSFQLNATCDSVRRQLLARGLRRIRRVDSVRCVDSSGCSDLKYFVTSSMTMDPQNTSSGPPHPTIHRVLRTRYAVGSSNGVGNNSPTAQGPSQAPPRMTTTQQ